MVSFYERPESQITSIFAQASRAGFMTSANHIDTEADNATAVTEAQSSQQDTLTLDPEELSLRARIESLMNNNKLSEAFQLLERALENAPERSLDHIANIAYDAYENLMNIGNYDAAAALNSITEGHGFSLVQTWNNDITSKPPEPNTALAPPSPFK